MKKVSVIFSLVLIALVINSCKKDFSIYAPGESITIVTGLLDASQDTQFVKINKTWQGDGNNLEYAMIRDSSEFKWEEFNSITVKEIVNGQVLHTYPLSEIERHDKEDGLFYGPDYTAYYFVKTEDFLDNATYRLDVDFKSRKDVWAETNVIVSSSGQILKPNPPAPVNFGSASNNGVVHHIAYSPKWNSFENAARYSASFIVRYKEMVWGDLAHTNLISEEDKIIHWALGEKDVNDATNGVYTITAPKESFYNLLLANMDKDPYISRQLGYLVGDEAEILEFSLAIANSDYNDFIVINQPSSSIVQERPQYTNVQNGIGIFASRITVKVEHIALNYTTYNVIPWISGMGELNLCTPHFGASILCE